jgi:phage-related baseplate assembly protein
MKAAANLLGYRLEAVQSAKQAGCLAFKMGNRIDLFELEEWFALHPEIKSLSEEEITILQAERIELVSKALTRRENYARMRRDLVRALDVRRDNGRAYLSFRAKMLAIPSSVSQKLALLTDANEIDAELRKRVREALGELSKSPWKGVCPHCGKEVL